MWPLLLAGPAPFCRSAPASPSAWLDVSLSRLASGVVCAVCNAVEPRIMPRTIAATADALLGGTTAGGGQGQRGRKGASLYPSGWMRGWGGGQGGRANMG
eukprot:224691-Chlamydomonas_euryale.AAC.1